jgi:thiol:disulfide interchange protein DsbD
MKVRTANSTAELVAGKDGRVALSIKLDPGWHTYWRNPGDSGQAPILEWSGGPKVGAPQWPAPSLIRVGPLANYGYDGELLLPFPVEGKGTLKLEAEYLVCKEECIPAFAKLSLKLPAKASREFPAPLPRRELTASARGRSVLLEAPGGHFFADAEAGIAAAGGQNASAGRLRLPLADDAPGAPRALTGVLVDGGSAWEVTARVEPGVAAPELTAALGLAFLGGLLLNLMPCVLPILSIKILGFVEKKKDGLAYSAGVIASFWALAALLLLLRFNGVQVGWGFQLQSPWLLAALAVLFIGIGANLLGLFEIGASFTRLGGKTGSPFLSGVLAVIVATPCTAPFMGAALGAALTMPAWAALLVFTALGAGMSLPYAALTYYPAGLKWLPKPGAWMETFKQALSFPMFLTAAWLISVLNGTAGKVSAALVAAGLIYWGWKRQRRTTLTIAIFLLLWISGAAEKKGLEWRPWSSENVRALQAQGKTVFVDFTADWCVTCQVNERTTLRSRAVLEQFEKLNVVPLKADWTRRDPEITAELERFGRSGVPVYVVHAPNKAPLVLPAVITPNMVVNALESAAPKGE